MRDSFINILDIIVYVMLLVCSISLLLCVNNLEQANDKIDELDKVIGNQAIMILEKNTVISNLKNENNDYKKTISDLTDKLEILVTFKDAGFTSSSISETRRLLELADNIPYGSPFKNGHRYTSMYGSRDESVFGGSPNGHHKGVDIIPLKPNDTTVRATANGEIVDFGVSEVMGKYIVFETSSGYRLKYAHLKTIYWQDVPNKQVKNIPISKGDKLGIMGNTGTWSTGSHLHLEIHVLDSDSETYKELNPWRIIEFIGGLKNE